ncbi:MAG: hypothetical protein M3Y58_21005 [Chloroflexota bacterium]|nr:hypothetical protein [Chloroflexota bacterium]
MPNSAGVKPAAIQGEAHITRGGILRGRPDESARDVLLAASLLAKMIDNNPRGHMHLLLLIKS